MTGDEARKEIDGALAAAQADLDAQQAAFFAKTGRYYQLLFTHAEPPAVGKEMPPDRDALAVESAKDAAAVADLAVPELTAARVRVDQYVGPQGAGYLVLTQMVDEKGRLWERRENVGPEDYRAQPWTDMTPTGKGLV